MCYTLKERNGERYLMKDFKNDYVPTNESILAETFNTKKQADSVYNSLCTSKKKRFYVFLVNEKDKYMFTETVQEKSKLEEINWEDMMDKARELEALELKMSQIKDSIKTVKRSISDMTKEKDTYIEALYEQLRIEDLSIEDCKHCVEAYYSTGRKMNAVQICKWFKEFIKHLQARRKIKYKISLAKTIKEDSIDTTALIKELDYQKNHTYEYRVLSNLEEIIGLK